MNKSSFSISTDKSLLQPHVIQDYLAKQSYWAQGIPIELVEQAIEHSLCFGVYKEKKQVGFARVVTDYVSMAYLADVFILPDYQGNGLGKQLMKTIMSYPDLQAVRRWLLYTLDAHGLYRQFGFTTESHPEKILVQVMRKNYLK